MTETIQPKRPWHELRKIRLMVLSATQLETFKLCPRKWWLDSVRKLKTPPTGSQVFGTVLHAVCERFLEADDLGRNRKTLQSVELFPLGWQIAKGRDGKPSEGEATMEEQGKIRSLIAAAIESGVLERVPNRAVEHRFTRVITENVGPENTTISITGFIDLIHGEGIQDHKTASTIKYLTSAKENHSNYLGNNLQMVVYAHEYIAVLRDAGTPIPETINLRHNQYITKDPKGNRVIKTDVWVKTSHVEEMWEAVKKTTVEMEAIRRTANKWSEIPDPPQNSNACRAYGGCQFLTICGGVETEQEMENRLHKLLDNQKQNGSINSPVTQTPSVSASERLALQTSRKDHVMPADFASRIGSRSPSATATLPTPSVAPKTSTAPSTAVTAELTPAQVAESKGLVLVPWGYEDCPACRGLGFNTQGSPCKPCDIRRVREKQPPSVDYIVTPTGEGVAYFQLKTDDTINGECLTSMKDVQPVKQQERTNATGPATLPAVGKPLTGGDIDKTLARNVSRTTPKTETPKPVEKSMAEVVAEATCDPATVQHEQPEEQEKDVPETLTVAVGEPKDEDDANAKAVGRTKKGFMLCINCIPVRGAAKQNTGRYVHNLNLKMHEIGQEMVKQSGKAGVVSFYELDAFKRRDALAAFAPTLAATFGADMVVVTGLGHGASDMKALVDALEPLAGMVMKAEQN